MLQPRHRLAECIQKYICCLQETHFRPRHRQTESERREKYIPCKWKAKESWRSFLLISDKTDLKIKNITRDKEGYYIVIKGSVQEDITTVNLSAPNRGAPQYIRQTLTDIKGAADSNPTVVGDSNTPSSPTHRPSKQKIDEEHKS